MQLFDFAVVFFSNECRGGCGRSVVWLKEMAVLENERQSSDRGYQQVSVARQCWASMGKGCLDILGLDCNGSDTEGKMLHTDRRSHFWTVDKAGKYGAG